ncbi:putative zinc-binding metallopeptidase [Sporichthya sp.]|uniref:zinc-binding metallopeptidase family protein n=1 Tax=Sporichthya sp. TaxID=65475 RepID=UPI00179C1EE9|nr:putative zinc-binding metallopeptidase [Sporichthya sp.]MBA3742380.1 putative zinc-binding metallopeptidase [Sporichthya sp.]
MRSFDCPKCGSLLFFENSHCLNCDTEVGFDRETAALALATPETRCANSLAAECNWLVDTLGELCACCDLTRTRPNNDDLGGMAAFARAEAAKRRLLYQLDDLNLPVVSREEDPALGLAFDLLSSVDGPVTTGHADGVISLDLAEGDDGHREAMRVRLDEPYRTLLGHFRHEIGHYYWMLLVENTAVLSVFRALFGDERTDYGAALSAHYTSYTAPGWEETYVSIYATAHPWEDWAETFAHYLHIRDTLQTAAAFGVVVAGPDVQATPDPTAPLTSIPMEEMDDFDDLINSWLPLTYALNAVNRSMGKKDLYPFLLSPTVQEKLRLVHALLTRRQPARQR